METIILTPKDVQSAFDNIEALCNVVYLLNEEADRPEKVRLYASTSEQQLNGLRGLLFEAIRME
jgi:hypothetical protein